MIVTLSDNYNESEAQSSGLSRAFLLFTRSFTSFDVFYLGFGKCARHRRVGVLRCCCWHVMRGWLGFTVSMLNALKASGYFVRIDRTR